MAMKRNISIVALFISLLMLTFVGCDNNEYPIVTLDKQNGEPNEQVQLTQKTDIAYNNGINLFSNPSRQGWFFNGWFLDKECTQSVSQYKIEKDVTFYAGWTDCVSFAGSYEPWNVSYDDLFTLSGTAMLVERPYVANFMEVELTLTITATGDFTGDKSTDKLSVWVAYEWLNDEQFLGEYVSDEVIARASTLITLEKSNNFSVSDYKVIEGNGTVSGVTPSTFNIARTRVRISRINGDQMLQYRHDI